MDKKISLYFVRHGETYFNKYGKMQGWSDTPLTEDGILVARKTGAALKDIVFRRIVASDMGRTIATANLILEESACNKGKVIEKLAAFRESFFGFFEGSDSERTYAALAKQMGVPKEDLFHQGIEKIADALKANDPYGDAENYAESLSRMKTGLMEVVDSVKQEACNILVVTHGNVIRTLIHDIDPGRLVTVEIHNASTSIISYKKGRFFVESFNQI